MKKITLMLLLFFACFSVQAQISYEASPNYAKLFDITYDATVRNKMYARTNNNHILVSLNNGANWDLLYSYPETESINNMKLVPGNTALSFTTNEGIHILDLATVSLTHFYATPDNNVDGASPSIMGNYSVYNADGTTLLVITSFRIGFANFSKVFYTSNSGADWNEVYYTVNNDNVFIQNVAISPNNPSKLVMARGNGNSGIIGGVWISTNAGTSWTERIPGVTLEPIAFHPTNADEILIGSSIGFGEHAENLYKSTDGGLTWNSVPITWTEQTLNNIVKIVYNPGSPNHILILEENEIVTSNDGGVTWNNSVYDQNSTVYSYGTAASFNPFDANQVIITTDYFPQISNDGGQTLNQIAAPFHNVISVAVSNVGNTEHLYYGSQGGYFHKDFTAGTNIGYNTQPATEYNPRRNYLIADKTMAGRVFIFSSLGFFGAKLYVSTDYGVTRTEILNTFADDVRAITIDPTNSQIAYISLRNGDSSTMFKIDISNPDNAVATEIITPGEYSEGLGNGVVTGIIISAIDSNILYIAQRDKFYQSTNGGTTWVEKISGLDNLSGNTILNLAANPFAANEFTLATNIGIYKTVDAGENWAVLLNGEPVNQLTYSPTTAGVLVATTHSSISSDATIRLSIDNGQNWATISNATLQYIQSNAFDYTFTGNTLNAYIATSDLGVLKFVIADITLGTGFPTLPNNSISLYPNPASDYVHVTVSHSTGALESVTIFSVTGQKVLESKTADFSISGLSKGIYFVKVTAENGKTFVQKLIKK
ncbi:T9SS type A sorting domain-containing protein [Flavobacterium kingsejongi]|uniref:Secretion system C-terminal sorting domain-containing protein n=1 Tax=Flavobacterium kingsejongi TaxID=1678728 RepID=A0A2S1LM50_9FLAO|nr:T9SS type A sorting domain-containing protein [Flavobacterium kingsejongi]AWG24840.1 hypothetical protein FK004_06150 [Flavobacterium kingsejongi]